MCMVENPEKEYAFIRKYLGAILYLMAVLGQNRILVHVVECFEYEYYLVVDLFMVILFYIMPILCYYYHCCHDEKRNVFLDFYLNMVCNLSLYTISNAMYAHE